jgi:hypothetical protein
MRLRIHASVSAVAVKFPFLQKGRTRNGRDICSLSLLLPNFLAASFALLPFWHFVHAAFAKGMATQDSFTG